MRPYQFPLFIFVIGSALQRASCSSASSPNSPPLSNPYQFNPNSQRSLTFRHGLSRYLQTKWDNARELALLEQAVEDYNAEIVATAKDVASGLSYRRLIVLPLDERFDPPTGMFSHGHVQTGDKMSLPREFWTAVVKTSAEVPWLFEVSRVEGVTGPRFAPPASTSTTEMPHLDTTVGGAIDFRSPPNYVFLPRWMMQALALKPRDVVDVRLQPNTPPGSAVKLRPHTSEFIKIANHQAVLETELKHYSALTQGSTIPFDYLGKRYYFDVVELRSAPRGEKVGMAKVQDCDVAAEFVRARDQLKPKKSKKEDEGKD